MCVIMACETSRPTMGELKLARAANGDGVGLAWIRDSEVRFEKALEFDALAAKVATLPLPFVVHFRWASVGDVCAALCHPFPLRADKPLALKGHTSRGVLFHNGTWREWEKHFLAAVCSVGESVGDGPMSDTRAMAYLATHLGLGVLDAINGQRIAVLAPDGITRWGNWQELRKGLHVSNMSWRKTTESTVGSKARLAAEAKGQTPTAGWLGLENGKAITGRKALLLDDDDAMRQSIKCTTGLDVEFADAAEQPKTAHKHYRGGH